MSSGWQLVLIKCRREPRIIALILALVRIAICFWPQTGYIHPDEFFQSSDIIGGNYFKSRIQPVWEFTTDKPIRSMLIPSLLNSVAFKLVTNIKREHSAYWLLVAPRLIYTLLSFVVDYCLYKLCQYYSSRGLWYLPVSIIFQSSFVCLGCMTRTFSNVPEVVLFAILLVVVCRLIRPRFRIVFVTPTRSRPAHETVKRSTQLTSSILIGFIVTLGLFNRPTFPCFALVPLIYWFIESLKRNSHNIGLTMWRVLLPVAISSTMTLILLTTFDTYYYKDLETIKTAVSYLVGLKFNLFYKHLQSNWILTPYNFIRYNTNVNNLAKYGLHAPYIHMLVNIPFAFNILGLMFYAKLITLMVGAGVYRLIFSTHRVYALMILSTLTSTILLSFIPHQEFRFLLPLIVPLTYAFAFNVYTSNRWLSVWLSFNLLILIFYSSIHQSGVTKATLTLDPLIKSYVASETRKNSTLVDVVAFRCYLGPTYQWNVPAQDERFRFDLQDTIDDFHESVESRLALSMSRQVHRPEFDNHKLFIMLPRLYVKQLLDHLKLNYAEKVTDIRVIKEYNYHFSGEELRTSVAHIQKFGLSWSSLNEAFGFSLLNANIEISDLNDEPNHQQAAR